MRRTYAVRVTTISIRSEAFARGACKLRTALGPASAYLEDPGIVEVMLNPDGRLWIDRLSGGLEDTGCRVTPADAERIVRLVAHHVGDLSLDKKMLQDVIQARPVKESSTVVSPGHAGST